MKIRIGTRGSKLALWQARFVAKALEALPAEGVSTTETIYKTTGDHILDRPLSEIGGKGLFTKELEVGLLRGEIDVAVHSLKDMPTVLPDTLIIGAVPIRGDVRDCLITRRDDERELKRIGTASLRRQCLSMARWSGISVHSIRGNVQTRVGRLRESGDRRMDGVILAQAGLNRLGIPAENRDLNFLPLDPETWIPAVGQGAIAIECRLDDHVVRRILKGVHHAETAACTLAERSFLSAVEGDCKVPVGAFAQYQGGLICLHAFVGDPQTGEQIVHKEVGSHPEPLGCRVAHKILTKGGAEILDRVKSA